jgi:cytochrome c553
MASPLVFVIGATAGTKWTCSTCHVYKMTHSSDKKVDVFGIPEAQLQSRIKKCRIPGNATSGFAL